MFNLGGDRHLGTCRVDIMNARKTVTRDEVNIRLPLS